MEKENRGAILACSRLAARKRNLYLILWQICVGLAQVSLGVGGYLPYFPSVLARSPLKASTCYLYVQQHPIGNLDFDTDKLGKKLCGALNHPIA